tara:strand:- start:44 stop:682 length:639 start_codon:yes stop_codon:yes gene_type:complete
MVRVGTGLGMKVEALLTQMDHPIGNMIGNSHEIVETIACLKGMGPNDTMELVYAQAESLGYDISEVINNGSALQEFNSMLVRQGVDVEVVQQLIDNPWSVLQRAPEAYTVKAEKAGYVADLDAYVFGQVLCEIGAGRSMQSEDIDHGIGIEIHNHIGMKVEEGDPIFTLDAPRDLNDAPLKRLMDSITISDYQVNVGSRILERVTISDCSMT